MEGKGLPALRSQGIVRGMDHEFVQQCPNDRKLTAGHRIQSRPAHRQSQLAIRQDISEKAHRLFILHRAEYLYRKAHYFGTVVTALKEEILERRYGCWVFEER